MVRLRRRPLFHIALFLSLTLSVACATTTEATPPVSPAAAPATTDVTPSTSPAPSFFSRPYGPDSPWNTVISLSPRIHPDNGALISRLATKPALTSDPTQYAFPVYEIGPGTPRRSVKLSGYFSTYTDEHTRRGHGFSPTVDGVPVPPNAVQSDGSDGIIIFWDPASGDEWGFWRWEDSGGQAMAQNGYRYNTRWAGRFPDGLAGRGAGVPYFAGLVRPWEIAAGRIDHALAFAYAWPSPDFVYPASKSDGRGTRGLDLPEGSRLQLDPSLTEADFEGMGLTPAARVVARALQEYGMIVIDNSGSTKVMLEDNKTANWGSTLTRSSLSSIPLDKFRVLAPE